MRHLKTYESLNEGQPKVGDFVICNNTESDDDEKYFYKFLDTTIGKIIHEHIPSLGRYKKTFMVEFPKSEELLRVWSNPRQNFGLEEISYWSDDKEEIKTLIAAKQYNL